ncbi:MAG: hypothetical protein AAF934_00040 [Bacteroidota bacterium]
MEFYEELQLKLFDAEDEGLINLETWFNNPFVPSPEIEKYHLPSLFSEIYQKSDGMKISWKATKAEQAYGNMKFLKIESVLSSSWSENLLFEPEDLEMDERLGFFRPFDQVSPEILCGFIITPDETYESIYVHDVGRTSVTSLDVNFEGYTTMLYESRTYKNWPHILLSLKEGKLENSLITDFKADMPKLFPDFDWNKYVEHYERCRLNL